MGSRSRNTRPVDAAAKRRAAALQFIEISSARDGLRIDDTELIEQGLNGVTHFANRQLAHRWQQRFAPQVFLARQCRPQIRSDTIKVTGNLFFHHRALFLNDQYRGAALGKMIQAHFVHWPDQSGLVQTNAQLPALCFIQSKISERLTHIEISLACGNN